MENVAETDGLPANATHGSAIPKTRNRHVVRKENITIRCGMVINESCTLRKHMRGSTTVHNNVNGTIRGHTQSDGSIGGGQQGVTKMPAEKSRAEGSTGKAGVNIIGGTTSGYATSSDSRFFIGRRGALKSKVI